MKQNTQNQQIVPVEMAGSTKFGRYPKISLEETFNMMISDNFLVPYAGYKKRITTNGIVGRRIYTSYRLGKMIAVIDNNVYVIDSNLSFSLVGQINTFVGDVFIDENVTYQIAICDKKDIWIYNWATQTFTQATLDFQPGYITYQDTRFVAPNIQTENNPGLWRLSANSNGLSWPDDAQHVGALQSKADYAVATLRFPGLGNLLLVFGNTVTEFWQDVGAQIFPYQKNTSFNIDYGCGNPATIAANKNMVCWLGFNQQSGLAILVTDGQNVQKISTDGIDFKLGQVKNPSNSFGFLFEQYGHIFYQLTFADPADNFTYTYDFNLQKFYTLTDENMNHHIARNVAFFNSTYYFVSTRDGNIYELNNEFNTYDYGNNRIFEIPRIRITPSFRFTDASYFVINNITFPIEMGTDADYKTDQPFILTLENGNYLVTEDMVLNSTDVTLDDFNNVVLGEGQGRYFLVNNPGNPYEYVPKVDLALSIDGGQSFGSFVTNKLNPIGKSKNRFVWWRNGVANEVILMFRFSGLGRWVCTNGEMVIYR